MAMFMVARRLVDGEEDDPAIGSFQERLEKYGKVVPIIGNVWLVTTQGNEAVPTVAHLTQEKAFTVEIKPESLGNQLADWINA